jgi:phosphoribosylglycinamide formyltransferase 1
MPKTKVAVLLSGGGTNMAALLYASRLPGAAYEIVLVASNDPAAGGLRFAEAEGVPTFVLAHKGMDRAEHDAAIDAAIREAGAQYVALAGYMRVLGPEMVARWQGRMLNIHPSLLPKYRGLHTHRAALEAGDKTAGATVHLVSDELDAGETLGRIEVAILPDDDETTLAARVLIAEHQLYSRVLSDYVSRPYDPAYLLDRVRRLALALPETEERDSHGSPGFRTGGKSGKFFAYFSDQHHGTPHISVLCKTAGADELHALIDRDPQAFYRPAYYGASGWVGIVLNRAGVDWDQVEYWLQRSWQGVAPKRLTRLLDAADEF